MRGIKIILCMATVSLLSSLAIAQPEERVIESFGYPLNSVLDTLGAAGNGWAGGWYIADSSWNYNSKLLSVADSGMASYESSLLYPIYRPVDGKAVVGTIPAGWSYIRYSRYLDHQWTNKAGAVYWLSFVNDLENGSPNCWNVCSMWDSLYEEIGAPHGWGNDTAQINGTGSYAAGVVCQGTGPHWWVLRMNMSGDSSARVYMWNDIDPNAGEPDTGTAVAKGTYGFWQHGTTVYDSVLHDGFNAIHIEFSNSDIGTQAMFAEIRLGTSWAAVSDNNGGTFVDGLTGPTNTIPSRFALSQNYPNPFNPTTRIEYAVPNNSLVTLKVYNVLGQEVATLFSGQQTAGTHYATFDGSKLPSGVYFYRLQAGSIQITKKLMLLK